MSPNLSGKVCIVTGGSQGIGKGIALQLGESGAIVYITGRNKTNLENFSTARLRVKFLTSMLSKSQLS